MKRAREEGRKGRREGGVEGGVPLSPLFSPPWLPFPSLLTDACILFFLTHSTKIHAEGVSGGVAASAAAAPASAAAISAAGQAAGEQGHTREAAPLPHFASVTHSTNIHAGGVGVGSVSDGIGGSVGGGD